MHSTQLRHVTFSPSLTTAFCLLIVQASDDDAFAHTRDLVESSPTEFWEPFAERELHWLQQLHPAGLSIRLATLDDLPKLLELEAFWRSDVLSAKEATLRRRLVAHPKGQFVAVAPDGRLLGIMYTQRVASYETLLTAKRETELDLHMPAGPVIQLLSVVQRPGAKVGALLRNYTLLLSRLDATVERVCGVARCRAYDPQSGKDYQAHVEEGTDPGLRFHSEAGARMGKLVPNYRPGDTHNLGYGVMICYELRSQCLAHVAARGCVTGAVNDAAAGLPASMARSEALVCKAMGGLSYGDSTLAGPHARWPGGRNTALEDVLPTGGDAVGHIPSRRWDAPVTAAAGSYGAFVADAQLFDSAFFGVSPAETHAMDPQQRLLLEFGYVAFHAVCDRRESLRAADVGVFLGIMNADFATLHMQGESVYAATGGTISIAAGRISFVLGTQVPCGSYDTACSSALVALHGALSVEEIKAVLMRPGGGAPISDAEAAALIAEFDTNGDGELQFEEFAAMWGCDVQGVPSDSNMVGGVKADLRHIEPAAGLVGLLLALVKSSTRGAGLLYLRGGGPVNDSLGTAEV